MRRPAQEALATAEDRAELARIFTEAPTPSFLARRHLGTVIGVEEFSALIRSDPLLSRLGESDGPVTIRDLGSGWKLLCTTRADAGTAADGARRTCWLVNIREGSLAAAFEYPSPESACAAVPLTGPPGNLDLVEEALAAFSRGDLATLIRVHRIDSIYDDRLNSVTIHGAVNVLRRLLAGREDLVSYSLEKISVTEPSPGWVLASGSALFEGEESTRSEPWVILVEVEAGRIIRTLRFGSRSTAEHWLSVRTALGE